MVSIFATATFRSGANSLPPEIQVGRVVAGVGDASIELVLPFGRSGRQLFWSGGAAVVGVGAALVSGSGAAVAALGDAAVRRVPSGADIRSTIVNTARNANKTNAARAVGPGFRGTPS